MLTNDAIIELTNTYGLFLLFGVSVFEGPIVSVIAGYLLRLGHFNWASVMLTLVLADLAGDALMYWIGSHGQAGRIAKWRRRAGLTDERLKNMEHEFEAHGLKFILFGKFTHAPGMAINLAAGISRMNFFRFIIYSTIGTIPKTFVFVLMGYLLGNTFSAAEDYIWNYTLIAGIAMVGLVILYFARRKK